MKSDNGTSKASITRFLKPICTALSNFRRGTLRGLFHTLWFCATAADRARARFGPPPRASNSALCPRAKAYQRQSNRGTRRTKNYLMVLRLIQVVASLLILQNQDAVLCWAACAAPLRLALVSAAHFELLYLHGGICTSYQSVYSD